MGGERDGKTGGGKGKTGRSSGFEAGKCQLSSVDCLLGKDLTYLISLNPHENHAKVDIINPFYKRER